MNDDGDHRPIVIFDGDCGFCTKSVTVIFRHVRPRAEAVRYQQLDLARFEVTEARARHEVLWARPGGPVECGGVQAFAKLLRTGRRPWPLAGRLLALIPIRWIAHGVYRLVANNRHRLPGGTEACAIRIVGR